jgi:hypothetical protein
LGDAKGLNPLTFMIEGTEKIKTPYGEIDTIKVSRVHQSSKERKPSFGWQNRLIICLLKWYKLMMAQYTPSNCKVIKRTEPLWQHLRQCITPPHDPVANSLPLSSKSE